VFLGGVWGGFGGGVFLLVFCLGGFVGGFGGGRWWGVFLACFVDFCFFGGGGVWWGGGFLGGGWWRGVWGGGGGWVTGVMVGGLCLGWVSGGGFGGANFPSVIPISSLLLPFFALVSASYTTLFLDSPAWTPCLVFFFFSFFFLFSLLEQRSPSSLGIYHRLFPRDPLFWFCAGQLPRWLYDVGEPALVAPYRVSPQSRPAVATRLAFSKTRSLFCKIMPCSVFATFTRPPPSSLTAHPEERDPSFNYFLILPSSSEPCCPLPRSDQLSESWSRLLQVILPVGLVSSCVFPLPSSLVTCCPRRFPRSSNTDHVLVFIVVPLLYTRV